MNLTRTVRYHYLRLLRLRSRPHNVALGVALGVFIGCTPTIPFQTATAVPLAAALRASKAGAVAGVWVSNPITLAALYLTDFQLGRWILGWEVNFNTPGFFTFLNLVGQAKQLFLAMMIGGVAIGLPLAGIAYVITYQAVLLARERRKRRLRGSSRP